MFYEGLDDSNITIILDLTKNSTTILTSSRESLKWNITVIIRSFTDKLL